MEWLEEHASELFALVGAVYVVIRAIVALTPTPKDDEVLSSFKKLVSKLAWLAGLTLNQGIGPQKTTADKNGNPTLTLLICFALATSGCLWVDNPMADLNASQKVFAATVRSLTAAYEDGQIGEDEEKTIDMLIHTGNDVLKTWEATLKNGEEPSPALLQTFEDVLDSLLEHQARIDSG